MPSGSVASPVSLADRRREPNKAIIAGTDSQKAPSGRHGERGLPARMRIIAIVSTSSPPIRAAARRR